MPLARHDAIDSADLSGISGVSTHMPLARHDTDPAPSPHPYQVSTHMPLARHDAVAFTLTGQDANVSTHMPLARHD